MKSDETIAVGLFTFDPNTLQLTDNSGDQVTLRTQSAEVLAMLVARAGEVVSKDDILDTVWKDTFVTDDSLVQCIADIRRALSDTQHEIIQTFPKKGYRLNGAADVPAPNPVSAPSPVPAPIAARRPLRKPMLGLLAVLLVVAGYFALAPASDTPSLRDAVPTIAVLPFDDFSAGDDKGYLSDAISEGIITELARSRIFTVISRNSSFIFRDTDQDIREIANKLGVEYILEGSQQKNGDALKVTAQLIDGATAEHIWAHSYELDIGDLFIVQEKIIRTVADRVGKKIEERPLPPSDPDKVEALHWVMLGIKEIRKDFSASGTAKVRALSLKAIEADPDSSEGYTSLALTYRSDAVFGWNGLDRDQALILAETHADKAISLDPENSMAHYVRARIHTERNEMEKSVIRYARAIELNPSDSRLLNGSSSPLLYIGRTDEGIARIRQAMGLDPFHQEDYLWQLAWGLWQRGDCHEAETSILKMDNISPGASRMLSAALACQGKIDAARERLAVFTAISSQTTLSGERERLAEMWTAPGALDRWIEDLRKAGMAE